jgi:hypothetical protein
MTKSKTYSRILNIGDLHAPYTHPDVLPFLIAVNDMLDPDLVIQLGDEVDGHCLSFHDTDPDLPHSPSSELEAAIELVIQPLHGLFPALKLLDSNHGSLVYRRAKHAGIPRQCIRGYSEILQVQGWTWHDDLIVRMASGHNVYYHHARSGRATATAKEMGMCSVEGHHHGKFTLNYWGGDSSNPMWGVQGGCLIDYKSLAFAYGKSSLPRPKLGVSAIINGVPSLIPMQLDDLGRWTGDL